MNTEEDLTRALARHNPLTEQTVRSVTGGHHRDIAHSWTDHDGVTSLTQVRAGGWPGGRHRRRATTLLVAAAVTGLIATSAVVGAGGLGGLQGIRDRVAVARMPEVPSPDRESEALRYGTWEQGFVACLAEEYAPWVIPVEGGYTYDGDGRLATMPGDSSVGFDDGNCRAAAGPQPRPAPMTPVEARTHLADLRDTRQCLQRRGYQVSEGPSLEMFYEQWQDELPDAPPWTPYSAVPDADVAEATEACGLPVPASPPRWQRARDAALDMSIDAATVAGDQAAAVRFLDPDTWVTVPARCLTALGYPQEVLPGGDGYVPTSQADDPEQSRAADAVCADRYPLHPLYERPLTAEQLSVLYVWYVEQSAPCLRDQGLTVEAAPGEDVFLDAYPDTWRPYQSVDLDGLTLTAEDGTTLTGQRAWDDLQQACPQEPPTDLLFDD